MESKSGIRVGILVILGLTVLWYGWQFLAHNDSSRFTVTAVMDNVQGLQLHTPVRLSGVTVGEVTGISFEPGSLKVRVKIGFDKEFKDKIPADSALKLTNGILFQNLTAEIEPGTSSARLADNGTIRAVPLDSGGLLAQMAPEANQAVKSLTVTLNTLTPKLSATIEDLRGILKRTDSAMANVVAVTASTRELVGDPKIRTSMHRVMSSLEDIASDARVTAKSLGAEMNGVVKRSGAKMELLTSGAVDLLQKLAETVDTTRTALARVIDQVSDPRLQQSLLETVDLAKTTLARFNQIASDIHNLAGDPAVQSDLKSTLSTLKETTEDGQKLVRRVGDLVGSIKPGTSPRFGIGAPSLAIDFLGRANPQHFRSDISLRFPVGKNAFDLGLYDFAERYKLTAQYETPIQGLGAMRYGIYASKLGVGVDWQTSNLGKFRLDLFNPNNPQLDARALFRVNEDFSIWLGADSLMKRTTPLIGVRLSR